jgi:hypothetical protein
MEHKKDCNHNENGFCGCNFSGDEPDKKHLESYTGQLATDYFPLQKGSRGNHVTALQKYLAGRGAFSNSNLGYFGDITFNALRTLGLPTVYATPADLEKILNEKENAEKAQKAASAAGSLVKNLGLGMFGSGKEEESEEKPEKDKVGAKGFIRGLFGAAKNRSQEIIDIGVSKWAYGKQPNQQQFLQQQNQMYQNQAYQNQMYQQQNRKIPTAVWVAGGLVLLLVVGFIVWKIAK